MHKVFSYPLTVREFHLDSFGHVNNATYLQILEEARWQFITDNGYGYKVVHELKQGPIILEVNLKFMKELKLRQEVFIKSYVVGDLANIMNLEQTIEDSQGKIYTKAVFKVAFFDLNLRKIINPTDKWLNAIGYVKG